MIDGLDKFDKEFDRLFSDSQGGEGSNSTIIPRFFTQTNQGTKLQAEDSQEDEEEKKEE